MGDMNKIMDYLSIKNLLEHISPQPIKESVNKSEILTKVISTLIGLTASLVVSYYGVKWLAKAMDPTQREKSEARKRAEELLRQIGVFNVTLTDYELCIAANLVDPVSVNVSWNDIAGLDDIIEQVKESVILPFQRTDLFSKSELLQPPKGILLYGPPGCGKTMIAKATAKAAGARFINLQISSIFDKWYGESEKRAEAVFSLALKLQPTIIFIDEIDSFLRARSSSDHESTAMMKTQFMSLWDGIITDSRSHVVIMGATNRPNDVDPAILRRMPCMFKINLPNGMQRVLILKIILQNETLSDDVDFDKLSEATKEFSGSDLRETCRIAALTRIKSYIMAERDSSNVEPALDARTISMSDLTLAIGKMRQTKLSYIRRPQAIDVD